MLPEKLEKADQVSPAMARVIGRQTEVSDIGGELIQWPRHLGNNVSKISPRLSEGSESCKFYDFLSPYVFTTDLGVLAIRTTQPRWTPARGGSDAYFSTTSLMILSNSWEI